ncbi:MAG: UvrD-helicase domain-containing protein [Planctomycetota bacterium]
MPSESKFCRGLNEAQKKAVLTTEGPVLVLAGAGTGKTRVITHRIGRLLERGADPDNVLAVTFTNKAAAEMRERVGALVGKKRAKKLHVSTFHKFCLLALREHGPRVGLPKRFAICDESDQLSACKAALRELSIAETSIQPSALRARISLAKNRLETPDGLASTPGDERDELVARAWRRYEDRLARAKVVDFDDLLTQTLRLLREHDDVREAFRERFRYVLVDEYQDTNGPQYEILLQLAGGHRNLCVVGDDDQSIYGWRGADVSKILNFDKDFPGATVVRLETNYRSTEEILDAAYRCIKHNADRHEKRLRSHLGKGERVRAYNLRDENEEAHFVVHEIQTLVREEEAKLSDFAILFRTATQPRAFEAELRARAVPYRLVGGMSFFDRKEVRDLLAYLRLLVHPNDETAFLRILNAPPRGVGRASIERVTDFATQHAISVPEAFERADEIDKLKPAAAEAAQGLLRLLHTLGAEDPGKNLVPFIERVIEAVGYKDEVERAYPDPRQREERWMAVGEVLNFARNYVDRDGDPDLAGFLSELALTAGDDKKDDDDDWRDQVTLMTLHAAKGLEFDRVFLVGTEEGLLPHLRAVTEDTVEEERRLMYVGITRAKRVLTMTYAAQRSKYGRPSPCHVSRFLFEIQGAEPPKEWRAAGTTEPEPAKGKKKKKARRRPATRW